MLSITKISTAKTLANNIASASLLVSKSYGYRKHGVPKV